VKKGLITSIPEDFAQTWRTTLGNFGIGEKTLGMF
jgi:hypothetical protein